MRLAHRTMGWIVLAFLSLPVWSGLKVIQPYKVVSSCRTVQVQCFVQPQPSHIQSPSYTGPVEIRVSLHKGIRGLHRVCSSTLNATGQRETGVAKEGEVQCSARMKGGAVELTVLGLTATDTDIYVCEIEVLCPPPYLRFTGNGTLIHVLDSSDCLTQDAQRQTEHPDDEKSNEKLEPVSVPVVVLVILNIIVLIFMISFQIVQRKERTMGIRAVPGAPHKVNAVPLSWEKISNLPPKIVTLDPSHAHQSSSWLA
ncbi:cytotoxic T-lymphocyte protein 4 [Brachionichthys hirsutus]|uniref:cytotoxic T-lymphocyte protein 4 n=1 Tax=Brachionichthys hirsutus TaxID=412623 RepID=UPI003605413F